MNALRVDATRLTRLLDELRRIGVTEAGGVQRLAYTELDVEGREQVVEWMREAGLATRVDAAGNIIGRRAGQDEALRPIATGSHTDTVPNGGAFDGSLGVLAGIECAWTMKERGLASRHPFEVINFQNEEGGLYGSAAMVGVLTADDLVRPSLSGKNLRDGIAFIGGEPDRVQQAQRTASDVAAYVELHIEQGGVLEAQGTQIGVVEGIFGVEQWDVTVRGAANHAGTTPMHQRKDALVAAAQVIKGINEIARDLEGAQVGTVGQIDAEPGAPNVIPGRVRFSIDLRDLTTEGMQRLSGAIRARSQEIARATQTRMELANRNLAIMPAPTDPRIARAITNAAAALELSHHHMPSGAGHDAQNLARIAPIGMIFVPSVGGISHSPAEHSRPEDVVNGANVLLNMLLALDTQLD